MYIVIDRDIFIGLTLQNYTPGSVLLGIEKGMGITGIQTFVLSAVQEIIVRSILLVEVLLQLVESFLRNFNMLSIKCLIQQEIQ